MNWNTRRQNLAWGAIIVSVAVAIVGLIVFSINSVDTPSFTTKKLADATIGDLMWAGIIITVLGAMFQRRDCCCSKCRRKD